MSVHWKEIFLQCQAIVPHYMSIYKAVPKERLLGARASLKQMAPFLLLKNIQLQDLRQQSCSKVSHLTAVFVSRILPGKPVCTSVPSHLLFFALHLFCHQARHNTPFKTSNWLTCPYSWSELNQCSYLLVFLFSLHYWCQKNVFFHLQNSIWSIWSRLAIGCLPAPSFLGG